MRREDLAVATPRFGVEGAVPQAVNRRVRHEQRVVRIVVGKEALAAVGLALAVAIAYFGSFALRTLTAEDPVGPFEVLQGGAVFLSVRDEDKAAVVPLAVAKTTSGDLPKQATALSRSEYAVMMMTGSSSVRAFSLRSSSTPSMPGIFRSLTTRSGSNSSTFPSACHPCSLQYSHFSLG